MNAVADQANITGVSDPAPGLAERVIREMAAAWQAQAEQFSEQAQVALARGEAETADEPGPVSVLCRTLAETERRLAFVERRLAELHRREEAVGRLVWPPMFLDGPLAVWRARIEDDLGNAESGAFEVYLAVARFNLALRAPENLRRLAEALDGLGESAYRYWKHTPATVLDDALAWRSALNELLVAADIPLEIALALEGEPFDLDSMVTQDAGLGSRIQVKEPLSWIVKEKVEPEARVLVPARVIAC